MLASDLLFLLPEKLFSPAFECICMHGELPTEERCLWLALGMAGSPVRGVHPRIDIIKNSLVPFSRTHMLCSCFRMFFVGPTWSCIQESSMSLPIHGALSHLLHICGSRYAWVFWGLGVLVYVWRSATVCSSVDVDSFSWEHDFLPFNVQALTYVSSSSVSIHDSFSMKGILQYYGCV